MREVAQLGALEKGSVPLDAVDRYADRVDIDLAVAPGAGASERLEALRAAVDRELDGFTEVLPSLRIQAAEIDELRGLLAGDPALNRALDGLLIFKDDARALVDFLFVLRAEVYDCLADRATLTQADLDAAVVDVARARAARHGFSGIRTITDREPGDVFVSSIARGELQYDYFFKNQLFETVAAPGFNIHGHLAHLLQWLYYAWRHERAHPDDPNARGAIARVYRHVPAVQSGDMFRRLSDTLNSSVQLMLREGEPPNFKAIAANYRGFPASVTDPGTVTRLFELTFYRSLDPARPVVLEPTLLMVRRPTDDEFRALYRPETDDERRRWADSKERGN